MKKLLLTTALVAFASTAHAAGNTAQDTANATAHVVTPISIVASAANLDFGDVYTGTTDNTLITPATLAVAGEAGYDFTLEVPTSVVLTDGVDVANDMTADITSGGTTDEVLDANGVFTKPVTAELDVDANQEPGLFRGSYTVTVTYK